MDIKFTKEEANVLIQLIDIAVKTSGLQVAEAGVFLSKKISEAFKIEEKVDEVVEKTKEE
jgi:hypothetical protein